MLERLSDVLGLLFFFPTSAQLNIVPGMGAGVGQDVVATPLPNSMADLTVTPNSLSIRSLTLGQLTVILLTPSLQLAISSSLTIASAAATQLRIAGGVQVTANQIVLTDSSSTLSIDLFSQAADGDGDEFSTSTVSPTSNSGTGPPSLAGALSIPAGAVLAVQTSMVLTSPSDSGTLAGKISVAAGQVLSLAGMLTLSPTGQILVVPGAELLMQAVLNVSPGAALYGMDGVHGAVFVTGTINIQPGSGAGQLTGVWTFEESGSLVVLDGATLALGDAQLMQTGDSQPLMLEGTLVVGAGSSVSQLPITASASASISLTTPGASLAISANPVTSFLSGSVTVVSGARLTLATSMQFADLTLTGTIELAGSLVLGGLVQSNGFLVVNDTLSPNTTISVASSARATIANLALSPATTLHVVCDPLAPGLAVTTRLALAGVLQVDGTLCAVGKKAVPLVVFSGTASGLSGNFSAVLLTSPASDGTVAWSGTGVYFLPGRASAPPSPASRAKTRHAVAVAMAVVFSLLALGAGAAGTLVVYRRRMLCFAKLRPYSAIN